MAKIGRIIARNCGSSWRVVREFPHPQSENQIDYWVERVGMGFSQVFYQEGQKEKLTFPPEQCNPPSRRYW